MAVNIPLVSEEGGGLMPARYTNEVFILRRDDMELELKDETGVLVPSLRGELHVTNVRIVFIVGEKYTRKSRFRSVEIPFRGLENEALHQPIFGANNISGTIIPYDDQPFLGELSQQTVVMLQVRDACYCRLLCEVTPLLLPLNPFALLRPASLAQTHFIQVPSSLNSTSRAVE